MNVSVAIFLSTVPKWGLRLVGVSFVMHDDTKTDCAKRPIRHRSSVIHARISNPILKSISVVNRALKIVGMYHHLGDHILPEGQFCDFSSDILHGIRKHLTWNDLVLAEYG